METGKKGLGLEPKRVTSMTSRAVSSSGSPVRRVAVLAYHSSPLTEPGSGDAGGMTVYVRGVAAAHAAAGIHTDIFTRATSEGGRIARLSEGVRVISIDAGPASVIPKYAMAPYIDEFVAGVQAFAAMQRISYDIVHSHYWQSGLAAIPLAERWARRWCIPSTLWRASRTFIWRRTTPPSRRRGSRVRNASSTGRMCSFPPRTTSGNSSRASMGHCTIT